MWCYVDNHKNTIQSLFIKIQSQQLFSQIGISMNMHTYKNGNEIMMQKITHIQINTKETTAHDTPTVPNQSLGQSV
jgi:tripartite-type tricarboxylate transporter receptor subunit TctC